MQEPTAGRWNGDEWRWHRWSYPATGPRYIDVFDASDEQRKDREAKIKAGAHVVPFGFARALAPEPVERDPLTWEGSD